MVTKNNAVFRFILDIKDFVTKGDKVVQVLNRVDNTTTKTAGSMDRLGTSTQKAGQSATAAAVNFQTATQGMLNLTTAGVQTFTSFSNLDRAGNRLAQSNIAVARAQDLLNNKQLRLNELQQKGLGNSAKAVALTNELATARADLAVKTDKLKIEEGALLDIQLLFAVNIANVMISSLQTIKTLKELNIAATIKDIFWEKIKNTVLMTQTTVYTKNAIATTGMSNATKIATISTRGLVMALGPIGLAITGITVAMQAYNENWGGFRDIVQDLLPFLKDKKELLNETNDILNAGRTSLDGYSSAVGELKNSLGQLDTPLKNYIVLATQAAMSSESAAVAAQQMAMATRLQGGGGTNFR